ncbi:MAG: hypothetical protein IJS14_08750 [Lentisphaeria bacterium]|nr:hypothetical protein [Lentisphaeria bacterium]
MRKILLLLSVLVLILTAGCSTGKKHQTPASLPKDDGPKQKGYFAREREKKQRYEREFRDASRPMDQDHFRVMPWHGDHYNPRSERLHDNNKDSLFSF